jgi:hypothetical protein
MIGESSSRAPDVGTMMNSVPSPSLRRPAVAGVVLATVLLCWSIARPTAGVGPGSEGLTDQEFWSMVVSFSEPSRAFRSSGAIRTDNLVSNELGFQHAIPALRRLERPGAYLGVGPEQNFTYITAMKPTIAFIVDIRRDNMLLHLMYKAVAEMSADRADFLSLLFSRPRPTDVGPRATVRALFEKFSGLAPSEELKSRNLRALLDRLERVHRFTLTRQDTSSIESAYSAFCRDGPSIRWDSSGEAWIPSYADLMVQTDDQGRPHGYLASEANFRVFKEYQAANRIVPLVGDFAGDRTIRSVGAYLKRHHTTVGAFYTSNVEGYLFQGDRWRKFFTNVTTLPLNRRSTFIRTLFTLAGFRGSRPQYETSSVLDPIGEVLAAFKRGDIRTSSDLLARSRPAAR